MKKINLFLMLLLIHCKASELTTTKDKSDSSPTPKTSDDDSSLSSGENSSGTLAITATIKSSGLEDAPNLAMAIPVSKGAVAEGVMGKVSPAEIKSGALSLSIGGDTELRIIEDTYEGGSNDTAPTQAADSHVIVTVQDTGDRFADGETLQFINVPVSGGDPAMNLYTSALKAEKLELGELTTESSDLNSSKEISSDDFADISENVLKELATTDDALRKVRNNYMNYDPEEKSYIDVMPFFQWAAPLESTINAFSSAITLDDFYYGYGLYLTTTRSDFALEGICSKTGSDFKKIRLIPPTSVNAAHGFGDTPVPYTSFGNGFVGGSTIRSSGGSRKECMMDAFYAYSQNNSVGFNWGGMVGPIASGFWQLTLNDDVVGKFELASLYPFDANNKPKIYVPSIKMIPNSTTHKITSIAIEMYVYDQLEGFIKVTDLTAFKKVTSEMGFSFTEQSGNDQFEDLQQVKFPSSGYTITVDPTIYSTNWIYSTDHDTAVSSGKRVDIIAFQYIMYGNTYRFEYRPETQLSGH